MAQIEKHEILHLGHGCYVEALTLVSGHVLVIGDEFVGLYSSVDALINDTGENCLEGFWIPKKQGVQNV